MMVFWVVLILVVASVISGILICNNNKKRVGEVVDKAKQIKDVLDGK